MAASSDLCYALVFLLVCQAFAAPTSPSSGADQICSSAQLVAPGQSSLIYKYKTEVKLSVANGQFDLENEITADVHIKGLGDCNYALQVRAVKITESKDEDKKAVTSTASAQKELENTVVRFRWVDGFVVAVEADRSASVDHVNFLKGILSALQVYSPVPSDGENTVREEDVLGVCTTEYKYSQKGAATHITKRKDLSTCSKDKLHLGSSPVLTSLLGPLVEEVFSSKARYVCQTDVQDKKIQSVTCKTHEVDSSKDRKPGGKGKPADDDSSSSEEENDDAEISSKLVSIRQELKLQNGGAANVDAASVTNPVRQTLQFVPTASFDRSNEAVSALVSKIQGLLKNKDWDQFAASHFVDVTNELRRMSKANLEAFKSNADLKNLVPSFLNTVYSHDPAASLLNFDQRTLKFANPLSVFYTDDPSSELIDKIVQGSRQLTVEQVPEFVGLAANLLKTYKGRQTHNKDADAKIQDFQKSISKFLQNPTKQNSDAITAVLAAYAQLGLYDDQVRRLAASDQAPLEIQYHALNAIRHICDDYVSDDSESKIRSDLQALLLKKLQNKSNKNAVRVWAFEALYTSFIYNPEEHNPTLGDNLEKALSTIVNEPLNQVNGYIWSVLKYSSLDRRCPLRGLAARIRTHHADKKQYAEQATLSSRRLEIDLPLRKNFRASLDFSVVFENDRAVPSFIGAELAFDGVRRETLRLPWVEGAVIIENLDWNVADYFLRLDPLNKHKNVTDDDRNKAKGGLLPGLKKLQKDHDDKEEDPDPSVHLYLKLFGADIRSSEVTDKVQDLLRSNLRTFLRNQVLNRLKDLAGKNPIYRLPLEIGAASAAANGLTLYKSAQIGLLADFTNEFKNTRDANGLGTFTLNSHSAISFSLTLQREVSSPLSSVGETIHLGGLSNLPFEYTATANKEGRIREVNLPNTQATLLATDFQYSLRTSAGLKAIPNPKSAANDPSCTPSVVYRTLGIRACLDLNPFRSIQLGSRPTYPISITVSKDPTIKKWRIGWRFNAPDAPQYEVGVEKVGTTATYPGLGLSATKTGNNFDIKVLTGMKSFHVKGAKTGDKFDGKVFSSDGKEVMTTTGTLTINDAGFKLNSKLFDSATKKEVVTLATDILANQGKGLVADIALVTADNTKSFKAHLRGDLYKPDAKIFHVDGSFDLGGTSYSGKAHVERDDAHTRIELRRLIKLGKTGPQTGYDFVYERKNSHANAENKYDIVSHLSLRAPGRDEPVKMFDFKTDFARSQDQSNATLHSTLEFTLINRQPPVQEKVELDYVRRSVKTASQAKRLLSPQAQLKVQVKTKSNFFNALIEHKHLRSSEASKKGPEFLPPTLHIENKIHIAADSDKLLPDIPRPFAFDILSDLDLDLLNKIEHTIQYNFPRRQRSASIVFSSTVDKVTMGHLFSGTHKLDAQWDNKQKTAKGTGTFSICTNSRSLNSHWDIDTNLVPGPNDVVIDLVARFDRQPKKNAPHSFISAYNVTVSAPQHQLFQSLDLDGNLTRQTGFLETYNSIAFRKDKSLKELNVNAVIQRNRTGDGALKTQITLSLPLKNLPYITHELNLERAAATGRISHVTSQLLAEPVLSHYAHIDIDRPDVNGPPVVSVENEFEYLRGNGDSLLGVSKVNVHRWSTLHSLGMLKRNSDLLHKHSIGYIFSKKTRKVALSLQTPPLPGRSLSIIGELTIDRENRIGKLKWPQEFAVHLEFGTPVTNLTALHLFYNLPMFGKEDEQTVDASVGFKIASPKISPVSFYLRSRGSLNTTLHVTESVSVGHDISMSTVLTAQYNPQLTSQISASTSTKYYGQEIQNSLFALFKQHQVTVRGILNTTEHNDYRYEMDIGFDGDALVGHTERTDGQQVIVSDIDTKKCAATGKFYRCYKGDIAIRAGNSAAGRKGTFDISWGRGSAKLDVKVPDQLDLKFDHTHTGRVRDEDFSSKTTIDAKSLRADNKGSFSYAGAVEKEDGKWSNVQAKSSLVDPKTGQKAFASDIRLVQKVTDKRSGDVQRKIDVNLEHKGQPLIDWSSEAVRCKNKPADVLHGICQTATFTLKASNQLAQRIRQRLEMPADPKLASPTGQVTYDGKLNLDLKFDPKSGPHTASLDLNRLKEDAVDLDVSYQPRGDNQPMNLNLKANLPRQSPITVKYDETLRSKTNYNGVLKYSFNAEDSAAEKTFKCDVDRPSDEDVSVSCKGERTTLVLDIDRRAGKSKVYIDLNRFAGERLGYELSRDPQTKDLDATLYTLVSSWNVKRNPGKSTTVVVKQKNREVFRAEGTKTSDEEIQVKFSPSNVNLKLEWNNSTVISLKQTAPQQRNLVKITIDRARIRPYLPSLRNQNRPSADIDEPLNTAKTPLVEVAFDSHVFLSLSQALDKLGSHNGLYGLDTVKKSFKLQIGDAPVTVYNTQHWKTHGEDSQLPESYAIRVINNGNGNFLQLATQKWDETRFISRISHSFDGGKTATTDLKLERNYAVEVGSVYFFKSLGYRNVQGMKQLRNFTRQFLRGHLMKDLERTNVADLTKDVRKRVRSILDVDYAAAKEIVESWNKESPKSVLRQLSTRFGLTEFFSKYPTYGAASDAAFALLRERSVQREEFWRNRSEAILSENRLQALAERVQAVRNGIVKNLQERADVLLERLLPKVDQSNIDKRIADYVGKLVAAFEQFSKRNTEQWKGIMKAIDGASQGPDNQWFRTLVADVDSAAFAAAADAESTKLFKKLGDSSKLLINNIQQLSRGITKRREAIRERVKNAIRHIPKAYMNSTNFELLFPVGRQPGSYVGTSELMLAAGSLLRNRDQAFDTIRSVLQNRLESRSETFQNYLKAVRAFAKRVFQRDPSLTPEFKAVIAESGDAINFHGEYVHLNPACDYVLAHDFADLQFSFALLKGKLHSLIPNEGEIKAYQCSNTGRVRACCDQDFCTLNVPMYYGGRVDGALGDVRDRSGKDQQNLNKWSLSGCPAAGRDPGRKDKPSIVECASHDDDKEEFCENFVRNGLRNGKDKKHLLAQVMHARKELA